jgi:hypothetical protein
MWQDIKLVYQTAWRSAFLLPLLFLIPCIVEMAQHVVELNAGMYDSLAGAKAAANDPTRMTFGFAKIMALSLPTYWFVRLMAFADPVRAARLELPAISLWLVLFALNLVPQAYTLFGTPIGQVLGLSGQAAQLAGPVLSGIWTIIFIYLFAWVIAWTLGNHQVLQHHERVVLADGRLPARRDSAADGPALWPELCGHCPDADLA